MLDNTQAVVAIAVGGVVLATAVAGWLRWVRPRIRKTRGEVVAIRDSILGREAIHDSITGELRVPALPGIGVRMAENERQLITLTEAVVKIADSHVRIERLEAEQAEIKADVAEIKAAYVERVVTKAESAAAWRAIESIAQSDQIESD